jgi:hypothetical protein
MCVSAIWACTARFGSVDALFVIAMKDQPILRDLEMQIPN